MTEPMPASELDAIRARRNAATEGPWWFDESEDCWRLHGVRHRFPPQLGGKIPEQIVNKQILKAPKHGTPYAEYWPDDADAAFIAHAWKDMRDLLAEIDRLNGVALAAELERDVRLTAEDVERFLKRERDQHGKTSYWWRSLDEALDTFRLHVATGTPLTEPRPQEGPEALGVGLEPLTEAEELRAEVERLTAERDKLGVELATAKAVMYRALKEVEHEEVVYLIRRYLDVYPGTTTAFPTTTGEGQ